jgi:hypothetical protein
VRFRIGTFIAAFALAAAAALSSTSPRRIEPNATVTSGTTTVRAGQPYQQRPLSFEANRGQTDPQVDFVARGPGYTMFVSARAAMFALTDAQRSGAQPRQTALRMTLVHANGDAQASGTEELPGKINYLLGNDPTRWRTGIPTYARATYRDVYPGIDVTYYGNQRQLEYDFVVAPGADPRRVTLAFEGARDVRIDASGELVLDLENGEVRQHKPVIYQERQDGRQQIAGEYVMTGAREVGFRVDTYDTSRPLVIDPVLVYSTYLGGAGDDTGHAIAVDGAGSAYVAGLTSSLIFPVTAGAFQTTIGGGLADSFVTKLDASGAIVFSTYLGGTGLDSALRIAVDNTGAAYVAGVTDSVNFPTTAGAFQPSIAGINDGFVTKLNANGSALIYSTYVGGSSADEGSAIAIDVAGNAYVAGRTTSEDFPVTPGAFQTSIGGPANGFVAKLNTAGTGLVYSTYLGGSGSDQAVAIGVDAAGSAYAAGVTSSADFPVTAGALQGILSGSTDAFVTKLDTTGTALAYSTYLGGSGDEQARGIAVDTAGSAYAVGATSSSNFPTSSGAFQTAAGGAQDAFVTKLDAAGALDYSTYLGGANADLAAAIAVDAVGRASVTGSTASAAFPITSGAPQPALAGIANAFVSTLDSTGSTLSHSTFLGGSSIDVGVGIAVDSTVGVYVVGHSQSTDFPTTAGAAQPTSGGAFDAFVARSNVPIIPTLTTNASIGVAVGGQINDSATLAGGLSPTGTITFRLFGPADATCSGAPVFTDTKAVNGSGSAQSANFTSTQAGTYRWTASYAGDANHDPVAGACNDANESVVVSPASPILSTAASPGVAFGGSVNDTASLAGGFSPTGTITFRLFGPADATCAGAPVFTDTKAVNGSGSAQSASFTPTQVGTYRWTAGYSGDSNNNSAASACNAVNESVTVSAASPTLNTIASPGVTFGGSVSDTATLAGGSAPTGTITFRLYGPDDSTCSGAPVFTDTKAVNGSGSAQSASFTPTQAGTYRWIASYSGDANHNPVAGACNAVNESVTIFKASQTITFTTPATTQTLGGPGVTVGATATSGLDVTFSPQTPSICDVSGSTVTLLAIGTCTIAADQFGNGNYNAAPQVTQSFLVVADCGALSLPATLPAGQVALPYSQSLTLTNGTAPVTMTLNGALPSGLTFANGVFAGTPAVRGAFSISVTATDANSCQASASYALAIAAERRLVIGAASEVSTVRSFNIGSAIIQSEFSAFGAFTGGVAVAQGDVDGNGVADIIAGAGPGAGPTVRVFDGASSAARLTFLAFDPAYQGGVTVASGDVTGDGAPEILAAAGCAGGPQVRAFDGRTGVLVRSYTIPLPAITCRLNVAAGDLTGDGIADIIVGAAELGPSFVEVVDGWSGVGLREFYPYGTAFSGGVSVAAGDVDGDGFADIVTGAGPGGTPHVRVFNGVTGSQIPGPLGSFQAYVPLFPGGVRVGAGDLNGDGRAEVITVPGSRGGPHVRVWNGASATEIYGLYGFDPGFGGGLFVAGPTAVGRMNVDSAARTAGTDFRIAGWALREIASDTAGTDAIDAWAYPVGGGAPVFVGAAPTRVPRSDIASAFGGEFLMAGFDFSGTLGAGTYDLVVYARNSRTRIFDQVRVIRVTLP